jgi:peptidoglycan/xylan/chitin deacetylase (PgdA/CDA1 family)
MRSTSHYLSPIIITALLLACSNSVDETTTYCADGKCAQISSRSLYEDAGIPTRVRHFCERSGDYALTFDDGPSAETAKVLTILDEHDVDATFFVIGNTLTDPGRREVLKRAIADGHAIGNHTFTHTDLTSLRDEQIVDEINRTEQAIRDAGGSGADVDAGLRYVRAPFGYINDAVERVIRGLGRESVRWNADRYDWERSGKEFATLVIRRLVDQLDLMTATEVDNTSIIDLNHEHAESTMLALPAMINTIKSRGYGLVTLPECLES